MADWQSPVLMIFAIPWIDLKMYAYNRINQIGYWSLCNYYYKLKKMFIRKYFIITVKGGKSQYPANKKKNVLHPD